MNGKELIEWVAEYVANEGYDIASYNQEVDNDHNRFIEVKSYAGSIPHFYWSNNEFSVAKLRQETYWLYLVNRDEIQNPNYLPIMIQNPYENVLKNKKWAIQVEKYKKELTK